MDYSILINTKPDGSSMPNVEVTGRCTVVAAAKDYYNNTLAMIALSGAKTSVSAVAAQMSMGKDAQVYAWGYRSYDNTKIKGEKGGYQTVLTRDEQMRDDHAIIIANAALGYEPDASRTYIIVPYTNVRIGQYSGRIDLNDTDAASFSDQYFKTKFGERMRQILQIPYFDTWTDYVITKRTQMGVSGITRLTSFGIWGYSISTDANFWQDIITDGLSAGKINFPNKIN